MEQREIEVFLALADELHFGRAAERLHVSTARVSQTLKQLEQRIGGPLFERTSRRVALTPVGRRLFEDLQPAYEQMQEALERATSAARGVQGTLRVGFVGAASGQFVLEVAEAFRDDHPDTDVTPREIQFGEGFGPLRDGDIDMVLATVPVQGARQADLAAGNVLLEEDVLLAVSARHRFAGRESVEVADIAGARVLRTPAAVPDYWDEALTPQQTADGRPVERGPVFNTIQEMLALVGAGRGTYPVPAQATRYYVRPDVAYVPVRDAEPFRWRFLWLAAAEKTRIRAFDRAAAHLMEARRARRDDPAAAAFGGTPDRPAAPGASPTPQHPSPGTG
jgi:DNA-binding transcriptional LysR family regulator